MNPESPYQPSPQPQPPYGQPYQQPPYQQPAPAPQPVYNPLPPTQITPAKRPRRPLNGWMITAIISIVVLLGLAGLSVWAVMNYLDQKHNVDGKVSAAVATAVKDQADKDANDFLQKEKQPNRQFFGPDDYGRVAFYYPKTWSVYIAKDITNGGSTFEAYFNPVAVPVVSTTQQYALHLTIESRDYDQVLNDYKTLVSSGKLTSSSVQADSQNGTRLDGAFTSDIHGSAVIFKIRDKTVTIRTDAQAFEGDFNNLIKTITFNK